MMEAGHDGMALHSAGLSQAQRAAESLRAAVNAAISPNSQRSSGGFSNTGDQTDRAQVTVTLSLPVWFVEKFSVKLTSNVRCSCFLGKDRSSSMMGSML